MEYAVQPLRESFARRCSVNKQRRELRADARWGRGARGALTLGKPLIHLPEEPGFYLLGSASVHGPGRWLAMPGPSQKPSAGRFCPALTAAGSWLWCLAGGCGRDEPGQGVSSSATSGLCCARRPSATRAGSVSPSAVPNAGSE